MAHRPGPQAGGGHRSGVDPAHPAEVGVVREREDVEPVTVEGLLALRQTLTFDQRKADVRDAMAYAASVGVTTQDSRHL